MANDCEQPAKKVFAITRARLSFIEFGLPRLAAILCNLSAFIRLEWFNLSMQNFINSLLLEPRQCRSDWLILQAKKLSDAAKQTNSTTLMIFSCLETRNAIEQLWFEILLIVHGEGLTEEYFLKCRKRRDGYLAAINEAAPQYRKLSAFSALVLAADNKAPYRGIAWDLAKLKKYWQQLGDYCHAQGHSKVTLDSPEWMSKGVNLVDNTFNYFHSQMSGGATVIMHPENMSLHTHRIWEDYLSNAIDDAQVLIRLGAI